MGKAVVAAKAVFAPDGCKIHPAYLFEVKKP